MDVQIEQTWKTALQLEWQKEYFKLLQLDIRASYLLQSPPIYPPAPLLFNAFNLCPLPQVKVVILGQDPYHGPGQAMGLSFSVPDGVKVPPSLVNIFKELQTDVGRPINTNGNLEPWAKQGVLLLNATLTVEAANAGSHQNKGWEQFTDAVIQTISKEQNHVVFMLWGKYAQSKANLIDAAKHLVVTAPHPSPLSAHRGFLGCKHFSQANSYLQEANQTPIIW